MVFDNLYAHQGDYVAVSDDKGMNGVAQTVISGGEPEFQVLSGFHAMQELGSGGIVIPGTTVSREMYRSSVSGTKDITRRSSSTTIQDRTAT